jgi:hypothetical protein
VKKKPAPTTPYVNKVVPSNFSNLTNAPVTESAVEHVAAVIVVSEKTNVIKCEEELAPPTSPVSQTVPSDISD